MKLPDDFRDLLVCLTDSGAEFVLVGGFAVAHYGHVRATKDIDLFVRPTRKNASRVMTALIAFGAPIRALNLSEDDFVSAGKVVQLGVPPLRVDLLTEISGVDFEGATISAGVLDVDGRAVQVIGFHALLKNKRAAGRTQDLADVERLEAIAAT